MSKLTNKYSPEVRAPVVQVVLEHEAEHSSRWATISSILVKIGNSAHALNKWVKNPEVDSVPDQTFSVKSKGRLKRLSG